MSALNEQRWTGPPMDEMEKQALVALHHARGGDAVRLWPLLRQYGSARAAWEHTVRQPALHHLRPSSDQHVDPDDAYNVLAQRGIGVITWQDECFPAALLRHPAPPPLLYSLGKLVTADACAVGIVGSRRATRWARNLAYELGRDLAAHGITVVSGLALGVDASAHEGALQTGRTIGVIGCGPDRMYPAQNSALRDAIASQGAVLSQFPLGALPRAHHFPIRNDTIVRLVLGIIVVEAPPASGAMLTAGLALDRNVELLVCPGNAGRPSCAGSNSLLKEKGTAAIESAADVLDALRLEGGSFYPAQVQLTDGAAVPAWIDYEAATVESLAKRAQLTIGQVRAQLTELELSGSVIRLDGDRYCRL